MNPPDTSKGPEISGLEGTAPGDADSLASPVKATENMSSGGWLAAMVLVAGILAGLLAWGIGEGLYGTFVAPPQTIRMAGQTLRRISFADQAAADTKNAVLAFLALGGVLGVVLGAAGGLVRKSIAGAIKGVVAGLVLGCAATMGASLGLLPFYFRAFERSQEAMSHELLLPLLVHCGIWAAAGLAGGVALAIGLGASWSRVYNTSLGGLIGAVLGAIVYECIGAILLPGDRTSEPLAITWKGRLLARMSVAVLTAVLAAMFMSAGRRQPAPSQIKL